MRPAIDLVLSAFESHPLVGLSEGAGHGQLETRDLFVALMHERRFHETVRNILVEFGNARYQSVVDRYVSGASVARDELRHVWEDTTQVTGIWSLGMYEQMLAEVRSVNAALPESLRMRVLLGDPPIDWSEVTSPADEDMNDWRDAHCAHVIEQEVLARQEKALVLIGGAHLARKVVFPNSLIHLLDSRHPGQTWVIGVLDYGRVDAGIRSRIQSWRLPAGAPVRDTWLGRSDVRQIGYDLSTGTVQDNVDALLVLTSGPPRPSDRDTLDPGYARELTRRRDLANRTLPFRGAKIRFQEGVAAFTDASEEPLLAVLEELQRDGDLRLLVKAFADGSEADPATLTTHRAELVIDWLVARGIERHRLVASGCGTRRPLDFGSTAAGRALNRRAELVRLTPTAACDPPW